MAKIPTGVSLDKLQALLLHLVRCETTLSTIGQLMEPNIFDQQTEVCFHIIWSVSRKFWLAHKKAIPKPIMLVEVKEILNTSGSMLIDEEKEKIFKMLDMIYAYDEKHIVSDYVLPIAQLLLRQRKLSGIIANVDYEDLPAWHDKLCNVSRAITISKSNTRVDLLAEDEPIYATEPRMRTGFTFFDQILGGGIRAPETYGLLGPTGGGKTTFAIQLMCELCKNQQHVAYFSFEQPIRGDLSAKIYSCLTHIPYREFEGDISDEAKDAIKKIRPLVGEYMHLFDHCDKDAGFGGFDEIDARIYKECNEDRRPTMVIVDWILPMVERYMASKHIDTSQMQSFCRNTTDQAGVLTNTYGTTCLMLHQLNAAAVQRGSKVKPEWTDAAECKTWAFLLNYAIALGNKDNNNCMWLRGSKARSNANMDIIIELDGEKSRFKDTGKSFTVDERSGGGGFISSDMSRSTRMDSVEDDRY